MASALWQIVPTPCRSMLHSSRGALLPINSSAKAETHQQKVRPNVQMIWVCKRDDASRANAPAPCIHHGLDTLGKALRKPATSQVALTSAQQVFKRAMCCSRASFHTAAGVFFCSRWRNQLTAVSWRWISCMSLSRTRSDSFVLVRTRPDSRLVWE
jgi:hypothetical protein